MGDSRAVQIMKAISMFDPEVDYDNEKAREKLKIAFGELIELIDTDKENAREFFARFKAGVDDVIRDMGAMGEPEEGGEEVEGLPPEEELGAEEGEEEIPAEEEPAPEEKEEVSDEMMGASYNPLISRANSFLYT